MPLAISINKAKFTRKLVLIFSSVRCALAEELRSGGGAAQGGGVARQQAHRGRSATRHHGAQTLEQVGRSARSCARDKRHPFSTQASWAAAAVPLTSEEALQQAQAEGG